MAKIKEKIRNILIQVPIKKSLLFLFFSVFLIPFFVISIIYCAYVYKTMYNNELEKVQTSLVQTENTFTNTLNDIRTLSDRIYVNKQIQDVILKNYTDIQDVYSDYANLSFMDNYLHTYDVVANFRIYTDNQSLLNNSFIIKTTEQVKNEKWYENACLFKGAPFWVYKKDSITNKSYLSLIRSIWNSSNGKFVGVLVINISTEAMKKILGNQIYETIVEFNNQILYSTKSLTEVDEEKILNLLSKNEISTKKQIRTKLRTEKVDILAVNFHPNNSVSLKFTIMYIIPIFQLFKSVHIVILFSGLVLLLLMGLSFFVIVMYSAYINGRVKKVQNEIGNMVNNNFEISPTIGGSDEFQMIYSKLYEMSCNIKNLIDEVYKQNLEKEQIAARQSEMSFKMLSNQINPHFLFNTLETIRMKSLATGDKEIATMLKILASLLRYNLSVKGKPVPLLDEIKAIQNYLDIQHMRFGERISYDVVTMCDISNLMILPLLIQPIVENSFGHGMENRVSGGFIYILINNEMREEKNCLTITVKDNGCGIDEIKLEEIKEKLKNPKEDDNSSIGIYNVNSRIKLFYGEESGLNIESEFGEGTCVTMTIIQ